MVRILLIGNGAREHAMAEALVRGGAELYAFMAKMNPGIAELCHSKVKIGSLDNFSEMVSFCTVNGINFAIVGPEAPLSVGLANALQAQKIPVIGPTIECAQLESSKIFARNLMKKYDIQANIEFETFTSTAGVKEFIEKIGITNVVVKPDGLTGGKGVKVWGDHLHSEEDIMQYCGEILASNGRIIIEERLDGEEFTYITFVDGTHVVGTPLVQDNKRAFNGDKGPNTGGMGSYSMPDHLLPFVTTDDVEFARTQLELVVQAVFKETQVEYKGILYGQFMKTAKGIKIIEFNIRFGDPEAMNILPIMKSNFVSICEDILKGTLKGPLEFEPNATVCKYLVPEGYPTDPKSNEEIAVDGEQLQELGVKYYYAAVNEVNGQIFTSSSRSIGILGVASTLEEAEQLAEQGTSFVTGPLFHRTDIGTKEVLENRINHMRKVLNRE